MNALTISIKNFQMMIWFRSARPGILWFFCSDIIWPVKVWYIMWVNLERCRFAMEGCRIYKFNFIFPHYFFLSFWLSHLYFIFSICLYLKDPKSVIYSWFKLIQVGRMLIKVGIHLFLDSTNLLNTRTNLTIFGKKMIKDGKNLITVG